MCLCMYGCAGVFERERVCVCVRACCACDMVTVWVGMLCIVRARGESGVKRRKEKRMGEGREKSKGDE